MLKQNKFMLILLMLIFAGNIMAQSEVKEVSLDSIIKTPDPYPNNVQKEAKYKWIINQPGATEIQLYFEYADLEDGYDYIDIKSNKGKKGLRLTGKNKKNFWSEWIKGNNLTLYLNSDESTSGMGFKITRYRYRKGEKEPIIKGDMWAVVIGNGDYKDFSQLPCSLLDAQAMYKYLQDRTGGGMLAKEILYLQNANFKQMSKAYKKWLQKKVKLGDKVLFYYSGHGEQESGKSYLVPCDAAKEELYLKGIELGDLKKDLWDLPASQVLLILDSCYSGNVICKEYGGLVKRSGIRRRKKNIKLISRKTPPRNRIIMTSCGRDEQAIELEKYKKGAFTFYLLQGLRGNASKDGKGRIRVEKAFEYAKNRVSKLAKQYGHKQTPCLLKARKNRPFYIKVEDRELQISLENPKDLKQGDYAETYKEEISVEGWLHYGPGVKKVTVYTQKAQLLNRGEKGVYFKVGVRLSPGDNSFRIKVEDTKGKQYYKDVTVNRKEDPIVKLLIRPQKVECKREARGKFRVRAVTRSGRLIKIPVEWKARYGEISPSGYYKPPLDKGMDVVEAVDLPDRQHKVYAKIYIKGSNDSYEPNETKKQAIFLQPGDYKNMRLIKGERDWFKLELKKKSLLDIKVLFTYSKGDLELELYDAKEKLVEKSCTSNDNEELTKELRRGFYFIKIYGYQGAKNSYEIKIKATPKKEIQITKEISAPAFFNIEFKELKKQGYFSNLTNIQWDLLSLVYDSYKQKEYVAARKFLKELLELVGNHSSSPYLHELMAYLYQTEIKMLIVKGGASWAGVEELTLEAKNKYPQKEYFKQKYGLARKENIPIKARNIYEQGITYENSSMWEKALANYQSIYSSLTSYYKTKADKRIIRCKNQAFTKYYNKARDRFRTKNWADCMTAIKNGLKYRPNHSGLKVLKRIVKPKITWVGIMAEELGVSAGIIKNLVYEYRGKKYLDMSCSAWANMSHGKQSGYAAAYQKAYAKSTGKAVEKTFYGAGASFVMRFIPPGRFWMGSPDSEKDRDSDEVRHRVLISKGFWLQKTEITQGQWKAVTGETPWSGKDYMKNNDSHAAAYISWDDIKSKMLSKLGGKFDFPTEAQWEYACRSGVLGRFYWGESVSEMGKYANVADMTCKESGVFASDWGYREEVCDGFVHIAPGASLKPNAFGLYDMIGNVWEWCKDRKGGYSNSEMVDPTGSTGGSSRVIRGGSWCSNGLSILRCANRFSDSPTNRDYNLGGRLCCGS